jgi:hypothetical protein
VIRIVLVLAVVVAAAIVANVALLSVATGSHERVGQLSPVVGVSSPSARPAATQAASRPLRPQVTRPDQTTPPGRADEDGDEIDADD